MDTFIQTALAGVAGVLLMTAVMYFIHWSGLAEADMVRALGSLVTRNEEDAFFAGAAIHLVSGVVFSFVYVGFWSLLPLEGIQVFFLFGVVGGAFHGLVVSFLLVSAVAQRHPLERFRQAGMGVAVAHLIGHVFYGAAVGAMAGFFGLRFEFIAELTAIPS